MKDLNKIIKKLFDPGNNFSILLKKINIVTKKLTDDALRACEVTGVKPEDLYEKTKEDFL